MASETTSNAGQTPSSLEVARAVWHRRKWPALLVFATVISIAVPVIRNLPNVYESTATVLVEHALIHLDVLGSSADSELETRLRMVTERILSRARLYDLITRFNLYPDLRRRAAPEAVVEQMRRDIRIQFNGVPQPTGLNATIAFSLSYRGRDPQTVAQVTNALTTLYVAENTQVGEQKTAGTAEFLQAQLDDARRQRDAAQQKLLAFQERHAGELPGQQVANLAALQRLNEQLHAITAQEGDQTTGMLGAGGDTISARLTRLRGELADLRTRYTDQHPDVVRVKREIAGLQRQLTAQSAGSGGSDAAAARPASTDPSGGGGAGLRAEAQALQRRIALYQQRIENAPLIELQLQQLTQDYAAAREHYQSLQQRYEGTQLAQQMDQRVQGDQFRILDPAVPSQRPVGPHHARLLLAALLLSMGAGAGTAFLIEAGDTSFHTVDELRAFTTMPVLGSIPPIVTEADARHRRRQFRLAALGAVLATAVLAGGSFYLTRPSHALGGFLVSTRF